jgi:hypothetical protein
VGRHNELQRDHASHRQFFLKKRAEAAFGDLIAIPLEITLLESDRNR